MTLGVPATIEPSTNLSVRKSVNTADAPNSQPYVHTFHTNQKEIFIPAIDRLRTRNHVQDYYSCPAVHLDLSLSSIRPAPGISAHGTLHCAICQPISLNESSSVIHNSLSSRTVRILKVAGSTTARYVILSEQETESILKSASDCAEGECSIDDVSELIFELKEQEQEMQKRLEKIMNMIAHLQHINAKEERKTDEVRSFVRDMLRVFSSEKPMYFPTGFAGDIGDGPTTAYDALPPKKWLPTDKK